MIKGFQSKNMKELYRRNKISYALRKMARRTNDPTIESRVLTRSARRCCLCFSLKRDFSEKEGQIAHLDQNPANRAEDNLAFLCLRHHSLYDSRTSQHKNYTIMEVKSARDALYERVQSLLKDEQDDEDENDDEDKEAVVECDEGTVVRADCHKPYLFEMSAGQELVASIAADDFIDVLICKERDFNAWCNQDEDEWPTHYVVAEDVHPKKVRIRRSSGRNIRRTFDQLDGGRHRSHGRYCRLGH
jgi:hypothetical protein